MSTTGIPFVRELNPSHLALNVPTRPNKNGEINMRVIVSKTTRQSFKAQLGDPDISAPIRVAREPQSHDGTPTDTPSMSVIISDKDTLDVFKGLDEMLPREVEAHGKGREFKPQQYKPLVYQPEDGDENVGRVFVKIRTAAKGTLEPCPITILDGTEEDGVRDGSIEDLKPSLVKALHIEIGLGPVWKKGGQWSVTAWANQIFVEPAPKQAMRIGGRMYVGGKLVQAPEKIADDNESLGEEEQSEEEEEDEQKESDGDDAGGDDDDGGDASGDDDGSGSEEGDDGDGDDAADESSGAEKTPPPSRSASKRGRK